MQKVTGPARRVSRWQGSDFCNVRQINKRKTNKSLLTGGSHISERHPGNEKFPKRWLGIPVYTASSTKNSNILDVIRQRTFFSLFFFFLVVYLSFNSGLGTC
jgi:hypothetical protein